MSTAAHLAKAGFKVTVFEKNNYTGGRCSLLHHEGYRFDQGPSLLLLPDLFQEAFNDLDTSLEAENVRLIKCEPNYRIHFGDGESFTLSTDLAQMKKEIEKWEGKGGFERYLQFLQEAHVHYESSVTHVLKRNFYSVFSMLRPGFVRYLLALHPFVSIWSRASKYFYTERLRRVFTFGSMYMGMSPFNAPGTYSLLQYTELAEGIWYPEGGFNMIVQALERVGKRMGVEYRLGTPISSIALSSDGKTAKGVTLPSGETITADVTIINADLVYAYNNLLPNSSYAKTLASKPASCSSFSFYWALDRKIPELDTHNIFLADDYRESFDDIFNRQQLPTQPSFYLNVPSRVDPTAAPKGKDSIVVLVPCGHLLSDEEGSGLKPQDWTEMLDRARSTVIGMIEKRTGVRNLKAAIVHEKVNTPESWRDEFNLDKGAILGLSHSFFNVLCFRPRNKHASIAGLYFSGASTHPGTGVPICLAGARITSEEVLQDSGERIPWGKGLQGIEDEGISGRTGEGGKRLDRVERGLGRFWWVVQVLITMVIGVLAQMMYSSKAVTMPVLLKR